MAGCAARITSVVRAVLRYRASSQTIPTEAVIRITSGVSMESWMAYRPILKIGIWTRC